MQWKWLQCIYCSVWLWTSMAMKIVVLIIHVYSDQVSFEFRVAVKLKSSKLWTVALLLLPDAVPKPVLSISPMFSNQSAKLCNMTKVSVNCSIQDEWLMSTCDQDNCLITQGSRKQYKITVVTANKSVICIGSNQVSTSNVSASIDPCETCEWIHVLDSWRDMKKSVNVFSTLSFWTWEN